MHSTRRIIRCAAAVLALVVLGQCTVGGDDEVGQGGSVAMEGVDFLNRDYVVHGHRVSARDGSFEYEEPGIGTYGGSVGRVVIGDFSGDGVDEAAVVLEWMSGSTTGRFSDVALFRWARSGAEHLQNLGDGDRGEGGVSDVAIKDGKLLVERFGSGPTGSVPEFVTTETFVLRAQGLKLVGTSDRTSVVWLAPQPREVEIRFQPRTSRARLRGDLTKAVSAHLMATAGQRLRLSASVGQQDYEVDVVHGGAVVGSVAAGGELSRVLPATGRHDVCVRPKGAIGSNPDFSADLEIL